MRIKRTIENIGLLTMTVGCPTAIAFEMASYLHAWSPRKILSTTLWLGVGTLTAPLYLTGRGILFITDRI